MVLLCIPPFGRLYDLRDNGLVLWSEVLLLDLFRDTLGNGDLIIRVCEDGRTILCTGISALAIHCRWIMRAIKEFDKLGVAYDIWIKLDSYRLGVVSRSSADRLVVGVFDEGVASCVTNGCLQDALVLGGRVVLEKDVFDTPEASSSESCDFGCAV